ncbi:MAG: DUF899 family protein [Candidatus Eremiobacteraeota bacterium]|nr:DUF899 family protein [Candidatus Eremiobacteraeota bacterium]
MIDRLVAPGVSSEYREAREKLLAAEKSLMEQVERVAQMRRALPEGPEVPDYEFIGIDGPVRLSQLFQPGREPYLVMYHLMYWADDDEFCPMCSGWIDGLNAVAQHVTQRVNLVVASLTRADRLQQWARQRGWDRVPILADVGTELADAIGARAENGDPSSTVAVFSKDGSTLRNTYTMHPDDNDHTIRGIDLLQPVWHIFDLTPGGRGDFNLRNDYYVPVS